MRRLVLLALVAGCRSSSAPAPTPAATPPGSTAPATPTRTAATPAKTPTPTASALAVGSPAPDFALQGTDGRTHRLADYRGKKPVVLAWFPKAFTGG